MRMRTKKKVVNPMVMFDPCRSENANIVTAKRKHNSMKMILTSLANSMASVPNLKHR